MRILILLFITTIVKILSGQALPNGSFESWTTTGNYDQPTSWNTPNPSTASLGLYTVTKESALKQSGQFSAKIQTKSILGMQIPGLITLGTFSINLLTMEAKIEGGMPFTGKPSSLTGYIQYDPKLGDECFIGVLLLKQNGSQWDTLATGSFATTSKLTTWTPFNININYTSNQNPTHINVIILSSDRNSPQPNSTLYIDNLELQYPSSISHENQSFLPRLYYDSGNLILDNLPDINTSLEISVFGTDGRLIQRNTIIPDGSGRDQIRIRSVPEGVYIIKLTDGKKFAYTCRTTIMSPV